MAYLLITVWVSIRASPWSGRRFEFIKFASPVRSCAISISIYENHSDGELQQKEECGAKWIFITAGGSTARAALEDRKRSAAPSQTSSKSINWRNSRETDAGCSCLQFIPFFRSPTLSSFAYHVHSMCVGMCGCWLCVCNVHRQRTWLRPTGSFVNISSIATERNVSVVRAIRLSGQSFFQMGRCQVDL